jgi:hypothetical protein
VPLERLWHFGAVRHSVRRGKLTPDREVRPNLVGRRGFGGSWKFFGGPDSLSLWIVNSDDVHVRARLAVESIDRGGKSRPGASAVTLNYVEYEGTFAGAADAPTVLGYAPPATIQFTGL